MFVYIFGGASIKDALSIRRLPSIIGDNEADKLIVVVSALGKTTNHIEAIVDSCYKHEDCDALINSLKNNHLQICEELLGSQDSDLLSLFDEFKQKTASIDTENYDFLYDQLVSYGELFSSCIVSKYLISKGYNLKLISALDLVVADDNWRSGNVDNEATSLKVRELTDSMNVDVIVTQGFIGRSKCGHAITLGREGSDYSAAMMAAFSGADELTFWKDVAGVYTADPSICGDAEKIDEISFSEMVELSYFGAKILHKKTLSVLLDKNISTKVKSFLYPDKQGTTLKNNVDCVYPPIRIRLKNQLLVTARTKDGSLVTGNELQIVYNEAKRLKIDINLIQISATNISFCITYNKNSAPALLASLGKTFFVRYNENVTLETIRHYCNKELAEVVGRERLLLTQITRSVVQAVYDEH